MRVAILTHRSAGAQYFCRRIAARHEVAGVFVEISTGARFDKALRQFKRNRRRNGLLGALARLAELPFVVWLDRSYRRRQEDYFAAKLGEPLRCPEWVVGSINDAAMVAQLRELAPDVICVFGSSILRAPTIQCARRGVLNLHSGLLPEYRGAKSEFWALANGEFDRVGATVHFIDEGVDTGPIVARTVVPVAADDDDRSLRCKTIEAGVEAVLQTLDRMATGNVESFPQRRAEGKAYSTPTLPAYFRLKRNLRRRALAAGR